MMRLPPFFGLRALEAAARHNSYSRAAAELGVTHGAVSQQIRRLEAELGARLFERQGNAMIPTPAAAELADEISRALDILRNGVARFDQVSAHDPLVLSITPQFADRWLRPRLAGLLATAPAGRMEIRVEETKSDFLTDGVDFAIRYGVGPWPDVHHELLVTETMFPVCSPEFAQQHAIRRTEDLYELPLIWVVSRPWTWWFEAAGLPPPTPSGLTLDDSLLAMGAAAEGLGVALARSALVAPDLQAGRLVRPIAGEIASPTAFHVVWRDDSRKLSRIQALRDWLFAEIASS